MNSIILAYTFVAAIVIAGCVTALFSKSIDDALSRVIPQETSAAWSRFAKFALFTVTFVGGLRLTELGNMVATAGIAQGHPPFGAAQSLMEIFKSIAGSLIVAAGSLLAFFVVTLVIDAGLRVYRSYRTEPASALRIPERPAVVADRQPVGAERHSASRDRPRPEDSGKVQ